MDEISLLLQTHKHFQRNSVLFLCETRLHNNMTYTPVDLSVQAILQQNPEAD